MRAESAACFCYLVLKQSIEGLQKVNRKKKSGGNVKKNRFLFCVNQNKSRDCRSVVSCVMVYAAAAQQVFLSSCHLASLVREDVRLMCRNRTLYCFAQRMVDLWQKRVRESRLFRKVATFCRWAYGTPAACFVRTRGETWLSHLWADVRAATCSTQMSRDS